MGTGVGLLAAVLAAYPMFRAGDFLWAAAPLGGLGLILVVLALLFRGRFLAAGLFLLGTEYVLAEVAGEAGSLSVVGYAVGLVVLCELVLWLAAVPGRGQVDRTVVTRFARDLALTAGAAALLAVLIMLVGGVRIPGVYWGAVVGSGSGVILFGVALLLLRARD